MEKLSTGVIIMGLLDTIGSVGKGASEKAKNVSEANNLKRKILYEEERIVEIFTDLGKKYYKNPDGDPSELKLLCDDIDQRRRRIKKMRYELNGIRGYKICPKCDAEVNERFQFCGRCGARLPDIEDEDFMSLEPNDYYTESSNNFFNADSNKNY
jgi:ribosomal protein L40E